MKTTKTMKYLLASILFLAAGVTAFANDPHGAQPASQPPAANPSSDSDMSKALVSKINKGSGDIVIRTSDLSSAAPSEAKPAEAKAADAKPKVAKAASKPAEKAEHDVHWSYFDGPGGPDNWGSLDKANLACSTGKTQSPININVDRAIKAELPPLEFLYRASPLSIVDNGHTVMVKYGEGSNLLVDGRQYRLVQFHFHKPSEEAINGERTDMVVHLVHQHYDGSLAVVGVLMTTKPGASARKSWFGSESNKENPLINTLWNNIPLIKERVDSPGVMIDVNQLLPADKSYFTYMGSLTTPPCSENVLWFVMKNPIYVSEAQVKNFDRLYPMNARPLQPKGDRVIKEAVTN
jgi:carbonic anhydrase